MARRYAIADALGEAVERLAGAGLPEPRREARTLWAAVAGAGGKPGDVWLRRDRAAPADLARRFRRAVERRANGGAVGDAGGGGGLPPPRPQPHPPAAGSRPQTEGLRGPGRPESPAQG